MRHDGVSLANKQLQHIVQNRMKIKDSLGYRIKIKDSVPLSDLAATIVF